MTITEAVTGFASQSSSRVRVRRMLCGLLKVTISATARKDAACEEKRKRRPPQWE